jgi:poly-gamma-glutamate synthesis protein (capsule biosynthesis protein)
MNEKQIDKLTLLFAGDLVCKNTRLINLSESLKEKLDAADIFSINLEAPLEGKGAPINKAGPHLNQNANVILSLQNLGVNVVNCANNHICDYGKDALRNTFNSLSEYTVVGAGLSFDDAYGLKIKKIKNTTIGFLSFAENGYGAFCDTSDDYGYAWVNHESVNALVTDSKSKCDLLIIQVHAGVEEIDIPLPEWRKRYKEFVDLGASAVIASHPHVPQGWEMYRGAPIFYSLGNFFFDFPSEHPLWNKGMIAKLNINANDLRNIYVETLPIERCNDTVSLYDDQTYSLHLKHLCEILHEPVYSELIEQELENLWKNRYKPYYLSALNGVEKINIIRLLKFFKRLLMKETIRLELFHHLLFIESHFFAVHGALKQQYKKNNSV